jgi:hypothetical protein
MARKRIDIRDKLGLSCARRRTTNAAGKRDCEAAVAALIGADFQQFWFCDAVKACPIEAFIAVVQFAGDCGHECDDVGFIFGQALDGFGKV